MEPEFAIPAPPAPPVNPAPPAAGDRSAGCVAERPDCRFLCVYDARATRSGGSVGKAYAARPAAPSRCWSSVVDVPQFAIPTPRPACAAVFGAKGAAGAGG